MTERVKIHSDVLEDDILEMSPHLLSELLIDHSATYFALQRKEINANEQINIFWATDIYQQRYGSGVGYDYHDSITIERITGKNGNVIQPRVNKTKEEQQQRSRDKAEVFTPSWLCNKQNNLIDSSWFGREDVFNIEIDNSDGTHDWIPIEGKIKFPNDTSKTWQKYISDTRLEITCGEAPYLASRYDTITGKFIPLHKRIGLLDRKLRVVSEHCHNESSWIKYAINALQSVYGFEWQGDNVLIARESLFVTFIEYFCNYFNYIPSLEILEKVAKIISWNIWQMDGFKYVIPNSCHDVVLKQQLSLFDNVSNEPASPCVGCAKNDNRMHNGIPCYIMDWSNNKPIIFNEIIND